MAEIGIMLEGQEDLTWERFFRIAEAVDGLGFAHLFRSDHFISFSHPKRETLALWPSLTALALRTQRIRFGSMVCSMTFRHPAEVAKMAASLSVLSGGRFDLGLGAGWFKGEHEMYGYEFPPYSTRLELLDEGTSVIKALWSGQVSNFNGKHYQLKAAESYPLPIESRPTIIMGGRGEKTLKVIARHATEWNFTYAGVEAFKEKSAELDQNCRALGRNPASLRRSLMIPFVIGKDEASVQSRIEAQRAQFSDLPATLADWQRAGLVGGTPQQLLDQLKAFEAAGIERFMLQHNALDDIDSLELLANEVLPHFN